MSNIINIGGGAGGGGDASKRELTWLEYEALSEAEKNNGTMYFCTDANGDGSEFQPVIYSTTEREIGVWTDGKPLYEKSYPITNTNISTGWNILINNVSDIDTFVSGECNLTDSSSYDYSWKASYHYNGIIAIYNFLGGAISSANGYVTIRYTKTADTAGSGTWTPQGVPAVHYSEDEQIVGTWINGSTIYEKSIAISESNFVVGWKWFTVNLTCDHLIDAEVWLKDNNLAYCYTSIPVAVDYSNGNIGVCNNMGGTMGNVTGYVTVRYTKATS